MTDTLVQVIRYADGGWDIWRDGEFLGFHEGGYGDGTGEMGLFRESPWRDVETPCGPAQEADFSNYSEVKR